MSGWKTSWNRVRGAELIADTWPLWGEGVGELEGWDCCGGWEAIVAEGVGASSTPCGLLTMWF